MSYQGLTFQEINLSVLTICFKYIVLVSQREVTCSSLLGFGELTSDAALTLLKREIPQFETSMSRLFLLLLFVVLVVSRTPERYENALTREQRNCSQQTSKENLRSKKVKLT